MIDITDEEFDTLITNALNAIPKLYVEKLDNVAIVIADEPSPEQRQKLKLHCNHLLFGLYEGIPLTRRGTGYSMVLPDKITLFKFPILAVSNTMNELQAQVTHTLWHEIAHYYGLNHDDIHALEQKMFSRKDK